MEPSGALRPSFEIHVPGANVKSLTARFTSALRGEDGGPALPFRQSSVATGADSARFLIWVPDRERKLWSPWLHLDIDDSVESADGSDACHVFGRFSPAPSLWTGVMLGMLALGTLALGGLCFAWSQSLVGERPTALWLSAGALVGLGVVFASSRIGQARARHQMAALAEVVERCT